MDGTPSPTLAGGFFTTEPPGKPLTMGITVYIKMLSALRASLVAQLVKNPPAMLETWLGRFPREGNSYPLQYSDLENSMDCRVHGVTKS